MKLIIFCFVTVTSLNVMAGSIDCSVSSTSPAVDSISFTALSNGNEWQTGIAINWKDGSETNYQTQFQEDLTTFPDSFNETALVTPNESVISDQKGIIGGIISLHVVENQDEKSIVGYIAVDARVIEFICQ